MLQNTKYFNKVFSKLINWLVTALSFALAIIAFVFPNSAGNWNKPTSCKILIIIIYFLLLFIIIALLALLITRLTNKNLIWEKNEGRVCVIYGDILKIKKSKKEKQFIVIPVDTQFMTRVDDDSTMAKSPCVSPNSIHGKFIRMYYRNKDEIQKLETAINGYIALKEYKEDIEQTQRYMTSLKKRYKIGTVVDLKSETDNNCHFLWLAMAEYDEENLAHSSIEQLISSIISLLRFYDGNYQGGDLYIPLMGLKFSRIELTMQESLQIIKATVEQNLALVHGNVNIVVYEKNRGSISIF